MTNHRSLRFFSGAVARLEHTFDYPWNSCHVCQGCQTVETTLVSAREGGPMRPSVFCGLRGMGKTALLRRCASIARDDGAVVIYIEATAGVPMAGSLAEAIADAKNQVSVGLRIRGAVDGIRRALPNASFDLPNDMGKIELDVRGAEKRLPLKQGLEDLDDAVRHRDRYLVLAIDEIQEAELKICKRSSSSSMQQPAHRSPRFCSVPD